MIIFDNGAYSKNNSDMIDKAGFGFITRLQLNKSDDAFVKCHADDRIPINDDISFLKTKGNLKRTRFIFRSVKRSEEVLQLYRNRALRDWAQMKEMRAALNEGERPRKKYRISNVFVDTKLSYSFPLPFSSEEEAVEFAVRRMTCGREGLFVLLTNRPLTAAEALEGYRSRSAVETAFCDLKHGIDWRSAGCTSEKAIRGRILVSFLALFCMSMVRFLYPEFRQKTAESLVEELTSFSLTKIVRMDGSVKKVFSNFGPLIKCLRGQKGSVPMPKAPGQTSLAMFRP